MTLPRTPSQTVGPYYEIGLCRRPDNDAVWPGDPRSTNLVGTVYDGEGAPISDAMVEVWDGVGQRWARSGTDAKGSFSFTIAKPAPSAGQAPHLEAYVFARGLLKHQRTRIYFPDEPGANAADPVLQQLDEADRATLVAARQEDSVLRFDIRMQGDRATVFFAV